MKYTEEHSDSAGIHSAVVVRVSESDFQRNVLEKLGRLEAKVDMIVGNGQPGRMHLAEDRLGALEKNDLRRTVYDRLLVAGMTFAVTLAIGVIVAWRDFFGVK